MIDKQGENFEIRLAVHDDLVAMTEIYNMAIRSRRCTGHMIEFDASEREEWFSEHSCEKYPIYVAEMGGKVIGYVHISPYIKRQAFNGAVEITYYLDFSYRGRGVGTALCDFMLRKCRRLGYDAVIGTLLEINKESIGLLEKFGFELWGRMPQIIDMGNGNICDFVIYGLKL